MRLLLLGALLACAAPQAAAQPPPSPDHTELALWNVGLTGALALARGAATGNVRSVPDGLRVFAAGAAGGYGFFEAKRLIGQDRMAAGTALAFASASVVENVASGEHPLGFVRFGPGPFDLRVRTPLARGDAPPLRVEVDPVAAAGAVVMPLTGYRPDLCGVTLCYRADPEEGSFGWKGRAIGRLLLLNPYADRTAETHELIHYVQAVQGSAVTPFGATPALTPGGGPVALSLRVDWLSAAFAWVSTLQPYERRWSEVEAHALHWTPPYAPPCIGGDCKWRQH